MSEKSRWAWFDRNKSEKPEDNIETQWDCPKCGTSCTASLARMEVVNLRQTASDFLSENTHLKAELEACKRLRRFSNAMWQDAEQEAEQLRDHIKALNHAIRTGESTTELVRKGDELTSPRSPEND